MSSIEEVAAQLADELGAAVAPLAAIAGPDAVTDWRQALTRRCLTLAAELCQDDDDRLAAQVTIDVMCALWPHGTPEDHDPGWWRTPLGRAIARSIGRESSDAVSYSVAAAMLGVTRGTVQSMMGRAAAGRGGSGGLERHPDGGVSRASVLARLARG